MSVLVTTEQGVLDRDDVLLYNLGLAAYWLLNKVTGGASRRILRAPHGLAKVPFRRHQVGK